MTRETLAQEVAEAAETLASVLEEALRYERDHHGRKTETLFHGPSVVDAVYECAKAAGHAGLAALVGTLEEQQARELARREALRAAVVAGYREQGFNDCDVCGRLARFVWERTPAQLKRMRGRSVRGSRAQALPVSWRCAVHVPHAFPEFGEQYRDAGVRLARQARAVAEVA